MKQCVPKQANEPVGGAWGAEVARAGATCFGVPVRRSLVLLGPYWVPLN